tara:strand:- start:1883 stop:2281 length:399 start_codon:yes stop_codon:yes gene_type:complete
MPGYSPKLPLMVSDNDGISLNQTYREVANQNLKMLLLTAPGERVMDPTFGIGLQRYFFENATQVTYSKIEADIRKQVQKYLPYINILQLIIDDNYDNVRDPNAIAITIEYEIATLNLLDSISLEFNLSPEVL